MVSMARDLAAPLRYHWIEKWGEISGRTRQETLAWVWRAALENAPDDAVYRDVGGWKTITDIRDPATLGALGVASLRRDGR
jgi:hypothetical protein